MDSPYAHIACCIDDSEASRLALDEARRLRSLAPGRLSLVHVALPAAEACEWALEAGVDLIVAAAHRGVAARITLGSFAHYLIHHPQCPVLIARSKAPSAREPAS